MYKSNRDESWFKLVTYTKVEDYILSKFPDAESIQIQEKDDSYYVSFYNGPDIYKDLAVVVLTPFMTSIDGQEFDTDWIDLVRSCNKGRKIDGWTYEEDVVIKLGNIINIKKRNKIESAMREYNEDIKKVNSVLEQLGIEDELEPSVY